MLKILYNCTISLQYSTACGSYELPLVSYLDRIETVTRCSTAQKQHVSLCQGEVGRNTSVTLAIKACHTVSSSEKPQIMNSSC